MLFTVVSLAFLIVPSAPQTGEIGVVIGISPPKICTRAAHHSIVRQAMFHSINNLRRRIAKGEDMFPDILYKRGPRLMYAMRYSCELEQRAFAVLERGKSVTDYVVLKYTRNGRNPAYNLTYFLLEASAHWKAKNGEAQTTLMYPYVLFFGCAHNFKVENGTSRFRLVCLFDKKDIIYRNPRIMLPPCEKNADCKQFRDSECHDSLCWGPETPYNIQ